ncbi:hypothetical protein OWI79_10740, partial [Mammaliicoccus sciuri]|nr:hypothetical protein [Mammaliicoccus sciuri]
MIEPYNTHRIQKKWGIIIAIVFIASTLRAPLTSVGPVVDEIKDVMQINNSLAGFLTTIPLIIFADRYLALVHELVRLNHYLNLCLHYVFH